MLDPRLTHWGFCTTSASCPGASTFASWTLDNRPPLGSLPADDLKSALPWTDRTGDILARKHGVEGWNSGWKDRYEGPFEWLQVVRQRRHRMASQGKV